MAITLDTILEKPCTQCGSIKRTTTTRYFYSHLFCSAECLAKYKATKGISRRPPPRPKDNKPDHGMCETPSSDFEKELKSLIEAELLKNKTAIKEALLKIADELGGSKK